VQARTPAGDPSSPAGPIHLGETAAKDRPASPSERRQRGTRSAAGADSATVSLALLVAGVISTVAFAVIVAAGAVLSGNPAAAVLGLLASLYAPAAAAGIVAALHSARGRARLQRPAAFLVRLCQRLARRLAGDPAAIAARVLQRLGSFNPGLPAIASAFGYALVNWAADALCLAAAIATPGPSSHQRRRPTCP